VREETVHLDGPVHYLDFGGEGRPIVLVHGLGGAALNWLAVGPELAQHGRVYAIDLVGFGHTPIARRSASLRGQRTILDRFIQRVAGPRAVLVGNSMGGLLALQEAALSPQRVAGAVLVDPALPVINRLAFDARVWAFFAALLTPGLAGRYLKTRSRQLGARRIVWQTLAVCAADPRTVPADLVAAHVRLTEERMEMPWADAAVVQAARSLIPTLVGDRVFRQAGQVRARTLVVHGDQDRLIPLDAARELVRRRPDWPLTVLKGVGHIPMMEAPERFLETVSPWLDAFDPAIAV